MDIFDDVNQMHDKPRDPKESLITLFITVQCTGCKRRFKRWTSNTHQCPHCGRDMIEVK